MVMDRIFEAIPHIAAQHKLKMRISKSSVEGIVKSFNAILYADDTLLCANSEKENQALLWAVEEVSETFGLALNKKKCQKISVKKSGQIKFLDGTTVPEVSEAEYLGGILTEGVDTRKEVNKRTSTAGQCRYLLGNFWRKAGLSRKKKLQMYEALISAKLMYAMEIAPLNKGDQTKLDASFFKGIRQIMGWKTTYAQKLAGEEKTHTNKKLLEEASQEWNKTGSKNRGEELKEEIEKEIEEERKKKEQETYKSRAKRTKEQEERVKRAESEVQRTRNIEGGLLQHIKACGDLKNIHTEHLTQEQKEELEELEEKLRTAKEEQKQVTQAEANKRKAYIELGITNPAEEEVKNKPKLIGNKKKAKEKVVKTISERITERARKRLGVALRESKDEPINEVIKGEELVWKIPCKEYHSKCREGAPKLNWVIETSKQVWEKEKLWKKVQNNHMPINFNYRIKAHVNIIVHAALIGTF